MMTPLRITGLLFGLTFFSSSALAIDCDRSVSVVENTICSVPQLVWLDDTLRDNYLNSMKTNPQGVENNMRGWEQLRNDCTNTSCLRRAYFKGISQLFDANHSFDWKGEWWNSTAVNGNGGHIIISSNAEWQFKVDSELWGGVYKSNFSGNARKFYGLGFVNDIAWGGKCAILLMPRPDGKIEVSSDSTGSCRLLMPGGITIDGTYVRGDKDPRPVPTLLSLGIFPDKTFDDRFQQMVGEDYANYVQTANTVVYGQDLDNLGASVLNLSVKGQANRNSAIIMYTPDGKIWAMRVQPDPKLGERVSYVTTEREDQSLPKTLLAWRQLFLHE